MHRWLQESEKGALPSYIGHYLHHRESRCCSLQRTAPEQDAFQPAPVIAILPQSQAHPSTMPSNQQWHCQTWHEDLYNKMCDLESNSASDEFLLSANNRQGTDNTGNAYVSLTVHFLTADYQLNHRLVEYVLLKLQRRRLPFLNIGKASVKPF